MSSESEAEGDGMHVEKGQQDGGRQWLGTSKSALASRAYQVNSSKLVCTSMEPVRQEMVIRDSF